jgi:phage-related protein
VYKIIIYKDENGNEPIKDYIYELKQRSLTCKSDHIIFEKIITYLKILEQYGTRAGMPYVKHIDESIWELRPGNNRIFFFYHSNDTFVLLHYFIKKSRKTPIKELDRARTHMMRYMKRSQNK